ncbi:hypothetical protein GCM10010293_53370 [Streptomyces griseoflavus]|uniref:hypothetical protein n=1 Tax=Streptomyces griseoflavus TaxID=35619 RepID=UPI00167C5361|nr:hypothetical protein [Streptomyces griseoflavus]GGV45376.1 hypothetical protein GCM10010293_53370 [Streptomyces griseoflavus]
MTQPTITDLDTALDADEGDAVLSAAWDAFDVVGRLAAALAVDEGSDEIQAMLARIKCTEGRRLLSPPENGQPLETPNVCPGRAWLEPYGALLRHVEVALRRLASVPEWAEDVKSLNVVAGYAAVAADHLMTVRQDGGEAS